MAVGAHPSFGSWGLPPLYESGVVYELEPEHGSGLEQFDLPPEVYRRRWGDCDDLVIWRLLEHWSGVPTSQLLSDIAASAVARCRCVWNGHRLHVLIRLPNGEVEDPSRKLGMQ